MAVGQDIPEAGLQETSVRTSAWPVVLAARHALPSAAPAHALHNASASRLLSDADRRAIRELEDLRLVSASLFPKKLPELATLVYAGVCVEARQAGGDYYDFFDRGPGRLGFAVGDVSGQGMASALLRATLQASLRTLRSMGVEDFETSLALVNRLLLESAPEAMYATMFYAEYDERRRKLRYVNCGHPAPLLYGPNGLSRLLPSATVLGLFDDWECSLAEVPLAPGDTLLVYTDGATEAMNDQGEEFGEGRLAELLQKLNRLPLSAMLQKCLDVVSQFAGERRRDDLTLVALRCLEPA